MAWSIGTDKAYLGKWHLKDEGRLGQKSGRWGLTPGRTAWCVQRSRGTKLASLLVLYILGQSHVYSSCQVTALGWRQLPEGRKGGMDAFICRDAQSVREERSGGWGNKQIRECSVRSSVLFLITLANIAELEIKENAWQFWHFTTL